MLITKTLHTNKKLAKEKENQVQESEQRLQMAKKLVKEVDEKMKRGLLLGIYIFGSTARKEARPTSNINILFHLKHIGHSLNTDQTYTKTEIEEILKECAKSVENSIYGTIEFSPVYHYTENDNIINPDSKLWMRHTGVKFGEIVKNGILKLYPQYPNTAFEVLN